MSQYRDSLPQLGNTLFLMDGGLETTLVFLEEMELPYFAAFDLLSIETGRQTLEKYFKAYIDLALESRRGLILESPTWRAQPDWGAKLGYSREEVVQVNRQAIDFLAELRRAYETDDSLMVISGCMGPRYDGYAPSERMGVNEARLYHRDQVNAFAESEADMISALTMNYVDEAVGITQAGMEAGLPVVVAFTTETDGKLPDGTPLDVAINAVEAATDKAPAYYMINCAHPDHFAQALQPGADWMGRVRALRANASRKSHAELDESEELDRGNPEELGQLYRQLREQFPQFTVLGGCCGTDLEHIQQISTACRV